MTQRTRLEVTLDNEIQKNPGLYPDYSIRRVRVVARHVDKHPGMNVPYRNLTRIEDIQLYLKLHPEWDGKKVVELMKEYKDGYAFYTYVRNFAKRNSCGDEHSRKSIMKEVFPFIESRPEPKCGSIDSEVSDYEAYYGQI